MLINSNSPGYNNKLNSLKFGNVIFTDAGVIGIPDENTSYASLKKQAVPHHILYCESIFDISVNMLICTCINLKEEELWLNLVEWLDLVEWV